MTAAAGQHLPAADRPAARRGPGAVRAGLPAPVRARPGRAARPPRGHLPGALRRPRPLSASARSPIRLTDPFGMCELHRSFSSRDTLVVTPAVQSLPPVPLGGEWTGSGESRARSRRQRRRGRRRPPASTARATTCAGCTGARPPGCGELMVRREEQPWQSRAARCCWTPGAVAHRGEGPASSFEWAVSAAASIGVHLVRRGYARAAADRHRSERSSGGQPQRRRRRSDFEGALLDALAVVELVRQRRPAATRARHCAAAAATACWSPCSGRWTWRRRACWPGCGTARRPRSPCCSTPRPGTGARPGAARPRPTSQRASVGPAAAPPGWRVLRGPARAPAAARRCGTDAGRHARRASGAATRWPRSGRALTDAAAAATRGLTAGGARSPRSLAVAVPRPHLPDRRLVLPGGVRRAVVVGAGCEARPADVPPRVPSCRSAGWSPCCVYLAGALRPRPRPGSGWCPRPARARRSCGTLASAGQTDINQLRRTPIAASPGIEFLTVARRRPGRAGRRHARGDLRRAALAGLPLLALYTVPTAAGPGRRRAGSRSRSAGIGYLTLLLAEAARAGQPLGPPDALLRRRGTTGSPQVETAPLGAGRPPGRRRRARPRAGRAGRAAGRVGGASFGFGGSGFGSGGSGGGTSVKVGQPDPRPRARTCGRARTRPVIRYTRPADVPAAGRSRRVHRRRVEAQRARGLAGQQQRRGRARPGTRSRRSRCRRAQRNVPRSRCSTWPRPGCRCPTPPARSADRRELALRRPTFNVVRRPNSSTEQTSYDVTA